MRTMSYTQSRANFAETLNSVVDDREEVVITRVGRESVVLVSLEDYESLKESAYLLRSPENARHLLGAIHNLEAGGGDHRDLVGMNVGHAADLAPDGLGRLSVVAGPGS